MANDASQTPPSPPAKASNETTIAKALAWQVTMTDAITSGFGEPHAEMTRGETLRRGLIGVGGGSAAWALACLIISLGAGGGFVGMLFLGGLLGLGYGSWFLRRALGSDTAPTLERSDCWECADRIESPAAGIFCEECKHPIHSTCGAAKNTRAPYTASGRRWRRARARGGRVIVLYMRERVRSSPRRRAADLGTASRYSNGKLNV